MLVTKVDKRTTEVRIGWCETGRVKLWGQQLEVLGDGSLETPILDRLSKYLKKDEWIPSLNTPVVESFLREQETIRVLFENGGTIQGATGVPWGQHAFLRFTRTFILDENKETQLSGILLSIQNYPKSKAANVFGIYKGQDRSAHYVELSARAVDPDRGRSLKERVFSGYDPTTGKLNGMNYKKVITTIISQRFR